MRSPTTKRPRAAATAGRQPGARASRPRRRAPAAAGRLGAALTLLLTVLAPALAAPAVAGATDARHDDGSLDAPWIGPPARAALAGADAAFDPGGFDTQAGTDQQAGLAPAAVAAPTVSVVGKGFGHGRGMGQWGALGYATAWRIPYSVILDHFYGGTTAGYVDPATEISVRLSRFDDTHVVAASDTGNLQTSITGAERYQTVLIVPEADRWTVWAGADCAGTWGWWYVGASSEPVQFWVAGADPAAQDRSQWFALCNSDGSLRYYRGVGQTVRTPVRTGIVNRLPLDQYVRGVVPREMPASWADRDGAWGLQALAAQAVAARSYAFTEDRAPGYWDTCDSAACQVYGGAAMWSADTGGRMMEDPRSDEAVLATSGEVRRYSDGGVARTEYSASTGGWTAGGNFPAVADQGDALPDNPNAVWRWRSSAKALQDAYPSIGTLTGVTVTGRNGLGELGGRVTEVRLVGTRGVTYASGEDVGYYLDLGTDWFEVTSVAPAAGTTTGSAGSPTAPK